MSGKLTNMEHLRSAALRSAGYTADVAAAAAAAIEEVAEAKANKASFVSLTLLPSGWSENTDADTLAAGYNVACSVDVAGATAADSAECILHPAEGGRAFACGMNPSVDVTEGKITFYAVEAPTENITVQARLIKA